MGHFGRATYTVHSISVHIRPGRKKLCKGTLLIFIDKLGTNYIVVILKIKYVKISISCELDLDLEHKQADVIH